MRPSPAEKPDALGQLEGAVARLQHDPVHCVHRHIASTARIVGAGFDEALAPSGLTAGQFTLLMTLARAGSLSVGRLAAQLGMDPTTVSRAIRPLLERGWIALRIASDRRVRTAQATRAGIERLIAALPAWERAQAAALGSLESDWTDLRHGIAALRQGLRRIAGREHIHAQ